MKIKCPECEGKGLIAWPELGGQECYCPRCDGRGEVADFVAKADLRQRCPSPFPVEEDELHEERELVAETVSSGWIIRILRDDKGQAAIYIFDNRAFDPRWPHVAISVLSPNQLELCYMHDSVEFQPLFAVSGELELPLGFMIHPRERRRKKQRGKS